MRKELKSTFEPLIKDGQIKLNSYAEVEAEKFLDIFEEVNEVTYDELMKIDQEKRGYKDFFDKCKEEGILK